MPSPAITQSLSTLLPTLSNPPPRLLNRAESLLALSRQRAARLKPEEEIARAYAYCEIVCDWLRASL
jgi:origin recognition complex subunit 6